MKKQQSFKAQKLHGHKKITVELWGDKRLVWNNQNWEKNKTITIVRKQNRDHLKGRTFSREKIAKKWNYVEYVLIWHQTTTQLATLMFVMCLFHHPLIKTNIVLVKVQAAVVSLLVNQAHFTPHKGKQTSENILHCKNVNYWWNPKVSGVGKVYKS